MTATDLVSQPSNSDTKVHDTTAASAKTTLGDSRRQRSAQRAATDAAADRHSSQDAVTWSRDARDLPQQDALRGQQGTPQARTQPEHKTGSTSLDKRQPQHAAAAGQQHQLNSDALGSSVNAEGVQSGWEAEEAGWGAFDSSAAAPKPALSQHGADFEAGSHPQPSSSRQGPAQTSSQEAADSTNRDWSAFGNQGNAAGSAPSALPGTASQSAEPSDQPAFDSSNPFLEPGYQAMDPFKFNTSAFTGPGHGASQTPRQADLPSSEPVLAHELAHHSNPFLQPGEDIQQGASQAGRGTAPDIARTSSGESFGDFNAPGENDFADTAWGNVSSSGERADWASALPLPADPFAASGSFKDFAALLDPVQADSIPAADVTSLQLPVVGHVDLSDLQESLESGYAVPQWQSLGLDQAGQQAACVSALALVVYAADSTVSQRISVPRTPCCELCLPWALHMYQILPAFLMSCSSMSYVDVGILLIHVCVCCRSAFWPPSTAVPSC